MSAQTDAEIKKCLEDIKDICLVLTDPKEWKRRKEEKEAHMEIHLESAKCPCNQEEYCLNKLWGMVDWTRFDYVKSKGFMRVLVKDEESGWKDIALATPTEAILRALCFQWGIEP